MLPSPKKPRGGRDGHCLAISSQGNAATQANTGRAEPRARSVFCRSPCLPNLNLRQGRADSKHPSFGLQLCRGSTWDFGWCRTPGRQNPQPGGRAGHLVRLLRESWQARRKEHLQERIGKSKHRSKAILTTHPPRVPDFAFGVAVSPGLASVFYGDAALMAERQQLTPELPLLLGCLIAHEIGHLLLN